MSGVSKIIGSPAHSVVSKMTRQAEKNSQQTLTTLHKGRYILRTDLNDGTYRKTVLTTDALGRVKQVGSMIIGNSQGLKNKLMSLLK